nr:MAG TPA: hypothetical protein [Caudoviricetes sp.]
MHRVYIHQFQSLKCKKSDLDFIYISIHLCTIYIIIVHIVCFVKHFYALSSLHTKKGEI